MLVFKTKFTGSSPVSCVFFTNSSAVEYQSEKLGVIGATPISSKNVTYCWKIKEYIKNLIKLIYFYLLSIFNEKYNNKTGADGVHRCALISFTVWNAVPYRKFFIKIKKKLVNWNILVTNTNNSIRDFGSSGERTQNKNKNKNIREKTSKIVCY